MAKAYRRLEYAESIEPRASMGVDSLAAICCAVVVRSRRLSAVVARDHPVPINEVNCPRTSCEGSTYLDFGTRSVVPKSPIS